MNFKKSFVPQIDARDCGVAALASIAKYYGSNYSLAHLRELAKTNKEGTTALGIVKAAKEMGFETRPIQADMTLFDTEELPYPFIAHVNKDGKLQHYYVVYKNEKKHLLIGDPDPTVKITKISKEQFTKEWTGVAIFLAPKPSYKPHKDKKNGLASFLPLIFKQRSLIFYIVLASLLVTLINIVGSYYLQSVLDEYIPNQMKSTLGIISIGLIIAYILQQMMSFSRDYLLTVLSQRLTIDVILSYIRHIFELPMSFFATRRTGEIISRFTDANSIIDALASTILSFFLDLFIVMIVGSVLLLQNVNLFLLTLLAIPIYALIIFVFMKPFEKMNNDVMQSNAMVNSAIIEDINGIETIKSLTSEESRYQKIDSEFVDYLDKTFKLSKYSIMQTALKQVLTEKNFLAGDITFHNVSYKYGFGRDTLSDISLTIKKGDKISLFGISGSGKTTLAKMIVHFYEPYQGQIRLNGNDLKTIDKKVLRQYINYLPQQAYIFSGSILDNLTLGADQTVSQSDILRACEIAEIRSDIEQMPMGYQTELSDGAGLSGGQKQRIALARALLTKSPILILDEATSGLDVLTEKKVIDNLMKLPDKTIIFVAHRLSISKRTNQIIVLDQGKVIETGSHTELIERKGFYYHLFNK